jgi:hypothetical protein
METREALATTAVEAEVVDTIEEIREVLRHQLLPIVVGTMSMWEVILVDMVAAAGGMDAVEVDTVEAGMVAAVDLASMNVDSTVI